MTNSAAGDTMTAETVKILDEAGKPRPIVEIMLDLNIDVVAEALHKLGFEYVTDLGPDETIAKANITEYLEAAGLSGKAGYASRLLVVWKRTQEALKKKPVEPKKPEAVEIPKLPPDKKFDLDAPTISLEGKEFPIPSEVVKRDPNKKIPDPALFTQGDWLALARRTNLLHGVNINRALSSNEGEYQNALARRAALAWVQPQAGLLGVAQDLEASKSSRASFTSQLTNGVHNMMVGGEVHGSCPYGSAAASAQYINQHAEAQGSRRIFVSGQWKFPFAEIYLTECAVPSDAFLGALGEATGWDGQGTEPPLPEGDALDSAFAALGRVFDEFGHVASTKVQLGGLMYFVSEETISASSTKDDVEKVAKAAVDVKVGGSGGGASGSFQKSDGTEVSEEDMSKSMSWVCRGGDRTMVGDPQGWSQTLYDPNLWSLCERGEVRPLVEWLDPAMKARVTAIWEAGLKKIWGGRDRPAQHMFPILDNRAFFIKTGANLSDPALKAVGGKLNNKGTYDLYAYRNVDDYGEDSNDFLWTLVYSGHTMSNSRHGEPYYAIVTYCSREIAEKLRRLEQPGQECHALSAWDPNQGSPVAHSMAQDTLWQSGLPLTSPDFNIDEVYWTVEPIVDERTDLDNITRYRVVSRSGRALASGIDTRGQAWPGNQVGYLRLSSSPEESEIHLVPHPDSKAELGL